MEELSHVEEMLQKNKFIAVEIGLDLYWVSTNRYSKEKLPFSN